MKDLFSHVVGENNVKLNEPLSAHTTFRIGGPCDAMVFPHSVDELAAVVRGLSLQLSINRYPSPLLPPWNCCSDIANLSAHLRRLPTPPPYLRRMRLSPGRGAGVGCWIWL